jgi:PLP dependent protein
MIPMTREPATYAPMTFAAVPERLAQIEERIATAGGPPTIRVVAVTKGFGPEAVSAAVAAGLLDIGENYAHELISKVDTSPPEVRWHFLGELQRNKLSRLAPHVWLWQGLDSAAEADALAKRAPGAAVLVEVRLEGDERRHGVAAAEVPILVDHAEGAGLYVRGLMAVGPARASRDEVRNSFRQVARLARSLGLEEVSMGMSDDFELAVAEGATIVRLGRALFGQRPKADLLAGGAARLG